MAHSADFNNNYLIQFDGSLGNLLGGTNFDLAVSGKKLTVGEEIANLFADQGITYTYLGTNLAKDGIFYQETFCVGNIFFATNSSYPFGTNFPTIEVSFVLTPANDAPSSADDIIIGSTGNDTFDGLGGNDTITGFGGNDTLFGGDGNDTLKGNKGQDTLNGGDGDDDLSGGAGKDFIRGDNGKDVVDGGAGDDLISGNKGRDILSGGDGDDIISGNKGKDTLFGNAGDDLLLGGSGKDRLVGGKGKDTLFGGSDDDVLNGNRGNDTLSGDAGDDLLTGGGGHDRFIFDDGWGKDRITDFDVDQDMLSFKTVNGVMGLMDLTITSNAQGIKITDGTDVVILQGLGAGDIADLDFIF